MRGKMGPGDDAEYTHVVATVTASGDTTIFTPASGKRVALRYLYVANDPSSTAPLVKVKIGTREIVRCWMISLRQRVSGAANEALVVNLSAAGNVAVTAILEEF